MYLANKVSLTSKNYLYILFAKSSAKSTEKRQRRQQTTRKEMRSRINFEFFFRIHRKKKLNDEDAETNQKEFHGTGFYPRRGSLSNVPRRPEGLADIGPKITSGNTDFANVPVGLRDGRVQLRREGNHIGNAVAGGH